MNGFFSLQPSTIENLVVFIWQSMKKEMDEPELLHEVKLIDNYKNCVIFKDAVVIIKAEVNWS